MYFGLCSYSSSLKLWLYVLSYGKVRPTSLLERPMGTPEAKKRVSCKPEEALWTEGREKGETEVLAI